MQSNTNLFKMMGEIIMWKKNHACIIVYPYFLNTNKKSGSIRKLYE